MATLYRAIARALALIFILLSALIFQTSTKAYAAPLILVPAAGAALPLSVVSAGVGGGVSLISTGGALASAAITAAAAFAINSAVDALFSWGDDAPETFADPVPTEQTTTPSGSWDSSPGWTASGATITHTDGRSMTLSGAFDNTPGVSNGTITLTANYYVGSSIEVNVDCSGGGNFFLGRTTTAGAVPAIYTATVGPGRCGATPYYAARAYLFDPFCCPIGPQWNFGQTTSTTTGGTSTEPGTTPLSVTPTTKCQDPNGIVQTFAGTVLKTTRSTSDPQAVSFPSCPAGSKVQSRSAPITRDSDGAIQGDAVTGEITSTPGVWNPPTVPVEYPDCSNRTCVMTLTRTFPDGQTQTCTAAGMCVSYADVVKQWPQVGTGASTVARQAPDGTSYQCKFGPYAVAVAECQVIPGAGLAAGAETDTAGCKLGFSWNPVDWVLEPVKCALRWAFYPSAGAATGWQTRINDIKARPPVNIMVGGVDVITDVVGVVEGTNETACDFAFTTAQGENFDPICSAANTMQTNAKGQIIYRIMQIGIIGAFAWWAWRRIAASFGGKESSDT